MGRRIVAGAALAALLVTLSACACRTAAGPRPAAGAKAAPVAKADARPAAKAAAPCRAIPDRTGCYVGESDRDMDRLRDDLPPGGRCSARGAMGSDKGCPGDCPGCPHCAHK